MPKELERGNRWTDKAFADTKAANAEMIRQNSELEKRKSELEKSNSSLTAHTFKTHSNEMWNLRQQFDRQIEREKSIVRGHNDVIARIERFFPDTIAMIPALEECEQVGIPDSFARKLMDGGGLYLGNNVTLGYPEKREKIEVVAGTTFKFIRDPSDNKFHLHINGTRIFQWLKEQWQSLKQTVKRGFGIR